MGKTSNEVKARWISKAYHRYHVSLRYDTDQHLIDYIEAHKDIGVTQIIREALEAYIKEQG